MITITLDCYVAFFVQQDGHFHKLLRKSMAALDQLLEYCEIREIVTFNGLELQSDLFVGSP